MLDSRRIGYALNSVFVRGSGARDQSKLVLHSNDLRSLSIHSPLGSRFPVVGLSRAASRGALLAVGGSIDIAIVVVVVDAWQSQRAVACS